jgi:hypothetical protein
MHFLSASLSVRYVKESRIQLDMIASIPIGGAMPPYMIFLSFSALFASSTNAAGQQPPASVYTNLSGSACTKVVDDVVTGAYTLDCPGIRGFRLQVLQDDERSSVNVVTPDKRVLPLDYWDVVTHGFSTLGKKAEWRITKTGRQITPIAVIVRVNALDHSDPERPRRVPILAVAKVSNESACVTQTIDANASNANEQARGFADDEHLPCLPR